MHLVWRLGRKACILVHKTVIRDQWEGGLRALRGPGVRVGFLQGDKWQVDGYDVVIAMVLTLAKRAVDPVSSTRSAASWWTSATTSRPTS